MSGDFTKADEPIVYWSMWDAGSNSAVAIQEAIDAYCEASGNEVQVEWKGRDIQTIIGASIDAGEQIDIYEDDFQRLSTTFADYALPLDDMAEEYGYFDKSNEALTSAVEGWAGSLKCIPYQGYASGVIYNKAAFEAAGIEKEPETWEEFLDVCQKVKDAGYNPITCNSDSATLIYGFQLARYIGQDAVLECFNNGAWTTVPEAKKAAEDIATLVEKGFFSPNAPAQYPDGQNEIGFGESCMVLNASWIPNEILQNTGTEVDFGFFPWPSVEGGVDGAEASMVGAQGFGIVKESDMQQEAFDFATMIATGDYDLEMASSVNSIPADTENTEWPDAISAAEPYFKEMTKAYDWAVGLESNADFTPVITENVVKLIQGNTTPDDFVQALADAQ